MTTSHCALDVSTAPVDPRSLSPLYSPEEAAAYLRLSPATLAAWRTGKRGRYGPLYRKIGRRVFYRRDDLDTYIEERGCKFTGTVLH